jgi:hypothetical protein
MESDAKTVRGRPFANGNPGRKPGSKNKATMLAASLTPAQGEQLLQKAHKMAMDGNVAMLKFLLDRILPRERSIELELPRLRDASQSVDALAEIVDAVSSGRISPREAADVAQLVSVSARAIETYDTEMKLEVIESELNSLDHLPAKKSGANGKKN